MKKHISHYSRLAVALVACMVLTGCAETQFASIFAKQVDWPGQAVSKGTYKVGKPYQIAGQWYHPKENFTLVQSGVASWYGPNFHGKRTANGEIFDQNELTAAHKTLPLPSLIRVTNLENGRSLVLRVNDRGPFSRGRVLDVSKRGAELLGFKNNGTAQVRIAVLEKESRQMAEAAKSGMDTTRMTLADLNNIPSTPKYQEVATTTTTTTTSPPQQTVVQKITYVPVEEEDIAVLKNDAEMLPESLMQPTITVEQLQAPKTVSFTADELAAQSITGEIKGDRFMPDPVVIKEPVYPTNIFVQAGSFSVYDNAVRLGQKLRTIAPTIIDPVDVDGRKLYRVKLGPLADVRTADNVLARVIKAGNNSARVVK